MPCSVTLTAAPDSSSDSTAATTCARMSATPLPFKPSIRIRMTDGAVASVVGSTEWKSASRVTTTSFESQPRR